MHVRVTQQEEDSAFTQRSPVICSAQRYGGTDDGGGGRSSIYTTTTSSTHSSLTYRHRTGYHAHTHTHSVRPSYAQPRGMGEQMIEVEEEAASTLLPRLALTAA